VIKNQNKDSYCPARGPVLTCPAAQEEIVIYVLSCRPPGQSKATGQGRTGQKKLSCAHLWCASTSICYHLIFRSVLAISFFLMIKEKVIT
jgi:hypothetical protein